MAVRDGAVAIAVYFVIFLLYRRIVEAFKRRAASEGSRSALIARVMSRTPRVMMAAAAAAVTITLFNSWNVWLRAIFLATLLIQFGLWSSSLIEALLARYALRRAAAHKALANAYSLVRVLTEITEPVLAPLRKVIPRVGMIDITPMVAVIILIVVGQQLATL